MTRRRWVYTDQGPVEVSKDYETHPRAAFVMGDIPAYTSPIDGRLIDGRKARREDLKRNNCRPWEGRDQEQKEADRRRADLDQQTDKLAERMTLSAWHSLPPEKRRILREG